MNCFHIRYHIDLAQHIVKNILLRTDGAPFVGTGEKYYSIIDDTEIEIIKCLWETPEIYMKYAPPRRIWGMDIPQLGEKTIKEGPPSYYHPRETYKNTFVQMTNNTVEALQKLEQIRDKANILVFNRVQRGSFFTLAVNIKEWKKVYFFKGFQKAFESIKTFLSRFPQYEIFLNRMEFLNTKDDIVDVRFITEPCICILNETSTSSTKVIKNDDQDVSIISYIGRI